MTRPVSSEAGKNGYLGLEKWLSSQGIGVISSRERFSELHLSAPSGNMLLTTLPHERTVRADELTSLLSWVESGNTLVVLASLNDTPDWTLVSDTSSFVEDLQRLTGITFEAASNSDDEPLLVGALLEQTAVRFSPSAHPLSRGVSEVVAWSDSTASIWIPAASSNSPGTAFLRESTSGLDAAWTNSWGQGHIITIAAGSIFTNQALGKADNGALLSNLIHWHLAGSGKVIVDDLHQGLSALYDPDAFYSDSRVGITVLFILLFWFVYMIGTHNRMIDVRTSESVPEQGDFVRAMGGFLARKLTTADAARLIFNRWSQELEKRGVIPAGSSTWSYLSDSPLVEQQDIAELREMNTQIESGEKIDLSRLHNCIQRIRGALG